jgi:hypothetical protein
LPAEPRILQLIDVTSKIADPDIYDTAFQQYLTTQGYGGRSAKGSATNSTLLSSQSWLWQEVLGGITARALPRPHGIEITPLRLGKLSGLDMSYTLEDIISSPGYSRASSPQLESTTTTSSGPEGSQPAVKTTGLRSWLKSAVWQALR